MLHALSLHGQIGLGRFLGYGEPPGQRAHRPMRPCPYLSGLAGAGPAVARAHFGLSRHGWTAHGRPHTASGTDSEPGPYG
jgi:hypothetical protein